jgi:GMP synthase (glutamine-hydrolysing)
MHLHALTHVAFEDPAAIRLWAEDRGHIVSFTRLQDGESFPTMDSFDFLVIMGGPMNIYEENSYPWLAPEKRFIKSAVDAGKLVIGVCLGAQLLADVLGGRVIAGPHKEIGWFDITMTPEAVAHPFFAGIPPRSTVFHWHGDVIVAPPGAVRIARSEACAEQGFIYGDKVLALQFHMETTMTSMQSIISNCRDEIAQGGPYVQSAEDMSAGAHHLPALQKMLYTILDNMEAAR